MKKYVITTEVNGGEYWTTVTIGAEKVIQLDETTVKADGVEIEFDERIVKIEEN